MVARNEIGSVESAIELAVRGKETLLMEAQHPEGKRLGFDLKNTHHC